MLKLIPLVTAFAGALATLNGADYKDISRTLALNPNGAVSLETFSGSVAVSTWDRAEVEVRARIEAGGSSAADRLRFDDTEIRIDPGPDSLRVATKHPGSCCNVDTGAAPEVSYTIRMPRTARLSIRDRRSRIEVDDLASALNIDTHRGTVRVERLSGSLQLVTHRGTARVDFTALQGASEVSTQRGDVHLLLPRDSHFNLQAAPPRRGLIQSDFPFMAHLAGGPGFSLNGAVNGGGPTLRILTARGTIQLQAK